MPARIVVMGPTASGKSTVGAALAQQLGTVFLDGDALHPPANIAKMRAGVALVDDDRWAWLDAVGGALADADEGRGIVVACSALTRAYRDRIRVNAPDASFLSLVVTEELARARAAARPGHFMPASLVASQLALWEPLAQDEPGVSLDAAAPVASIVAAGVASLA